jgi:RNA polymerase sigma factor (sigma-70 family)
MSSLLQHVSSDEQLTTAIVAGDDDAFEELYRRYARPLAAYGGRVLRDHSRGEDVAQTSLMRAYDALRRGTEPLRVKPWLYKIALNTALELKAKNGEVLDGESDELEDTSADFREARADILAGVDALPDRQRKVFVLREITGLPVGEVAGRLELTNQQVEQALFAARNRLAESLVFGERIDCETIRGLDRSQLTHYERRAVKSHVRACPGCRRKGGVGLSSLGFWLRDAWAWLAGAGAPVAKIGAVTVAAGLVGGAPAVVSGIVPHVGGGMKAAHGVGFGVGQPKLIAQLDFLAHRIAPGLAGVLPLPIESLAAPVVPNLPSEESGLPAEGDTVSDSQPPTDRVEAATTSTDAAPPADATPADATPADPAPADAAPADPGPVVDAPPADPAPADVPPDAAPADPAATPPVDTVPPDPAASPPPPDPAPAP